MTRARTYDLVVFGATGFTGRLVAEYLARRVSTEPFHWAIAGRSEEKLARVHAELGLPADVGTLEADVSRPESLSRMAREAQVVITTVGPYAQYGEPLVAACVAEGTDYVDLTGEPDFVSLCVERYHEAARDKGVRIVNCCGFDSIPHDLGALFTVERLPSSEPIQLEAFVRAKGMFSGGTWQSALGALGDLRAQRSRSKPPKAASEPGARKVKGIKAKVRYDREQHAWIVPLPTVDPLIVLRSARALPVYGPDFSYGHYAPVRSTLTLVAGTVGLGVLTAAAQIPPARALLSKVRPSGEGPSAEVRARAWFQVTFRGKAATRQVTTRVSGGDPGYTETAKMISEAALCLAHDRDRLPEATGVLTPAVAMGNLLTHRLQEAGIRFEHLEG
ncbi:saccharopine dehydrogenase family protein [Chondromyces apiculatus]|uniref:Putative membrane protein n=1 Tax=Chondromyces apiculatus DSM 436 TaxID=1192034 RepID=A0A017TG16_9BACT|nr:saccharopine dehydrogenase NADP-binding domain-containing protein [Chondromyces apiculatus]EYF07867.1 putative membrane protein [Chondromyces apiculatus DSM 436]